MAELMDVYDENRHLTGLRLERAAFLREGQFLLYVLAILENPEGRLLITRRAPNKRWAAGSWEIPGGGAQAGESSFQAVCREVREETGLDIPRLAGAKRFAPIDSYRNVDLARGDNYFVDIYHFRLPFSETDIRLDLRESTDRKCVTLRELAEIEARDGFLHYRRITEALKKEAGTISGIV